MEQPRSRMGFRCSTGPMATHVLRPSLLLFMSWTSISSRFTDASRTTRRPWAESASAVSRHESDTMRVGLPLSTSTTPGVSSSGLPFTRSVFHPSRRVCLSWRPEELPVREEHHLVGDLPRLLHGVVREHDRPLLAFPIAHEAPEVFEHLSSG